jgi:hypothetical protein
MPILSSIQPTFWWDRVPEDRAAEWDALVAGRSVYMGSQYLRAMEGHPKVKIRLAVWASEGTGSGDAPDRLIGVAVFQRVSIESRSAGSCALLTGCCIQAASLSLSLHGWQANP